MEQKNIEQINLDHINWKSSEEFFNSLRDELEKLDDKDESYNFTWVGKRKSIIEAGAPINKTLRPDMDASKNFDNTKNMLIVGDNLDALKLLQESYLGKIKMIYIDPPYNTGHDFVYHDNFTVKKSDYEDNTTDSEGNKIISEDEFTENSKSNGRFHSDWLSMMYPRLKLARNVLADDGIIFISIDDNEQPNLKKMCDEIFGEDNFVSQMVVVTNIAGRSDSKHVAKTHEYLIAYQKTSEFVSSGLPLSDDKIQEYKFEDNSGKYRLQGLRKRGTNSKREDRPNLYYPVYYKPETKQLSLTNKGGIMITPKLADGSDGNWRWGKDTFEAKKEFLEVKIVSGRNEYDIFEKVYLEGQDGIKTAKMKSFLLNSDYTSDSATSDYRELMSAKSFDSPKPIHLIADLARVSNTKNSIILDFFAGSGTTGHAVMDLNAEDGGNRKYILVQLDEPTDDKSEAKKAGYDTIDQITAERLRRAGDKIIKEHPDLEGKLDTGFRVFHIDSANEREDVRKSVYDTKQEDMFDSIDNIKHDRTPLDLLFGTIIYMALPLDLELEVRMINNNTVYFYGYKDEGMGMIACFDDNISDDTVKEIAKLKPLTAVFKDSSFKDSAAKINLSEIFRTISNETRVKVI